MLPTRFLRLQLGELLAADTDTWVNITGQPTVALVAETFTPSEDLVTADLTLATFTGSTPLAGDTTQEAGVDPATGEQVITVIAPAGGWRFECTVAPGSPETIFGFALRQSSTAALLGTALLATPVTITNVGDFIDLGAIEFRLVLQPMA